MPGFILMRVLLSNIPNRSERFLMAGTAVPAPISRITGFGDDWKSGICLKDFPDYLFYRRSNVNLL